MARAVAGLGPQQQQHRQQRRTTNNNAPRMATMRGVVVIGLLGLVWLCTTLHLFASAPKSLTQYNSFKEKHLDRETNQDVAISDGRKTEKIHSIEHTVSGRTMLPNTHQDNNVGMDQSKHKNTEIDLTNPVNLAGIYFPALDENGNPGYVHNATRLHNNPPVFDKSGIRCEPNDATMQLFTQRVYVDLAAHARADKLVLERGNNNHTKQPRAKIFCHIYTINKNRNFVQSIRETWGHRCDGFLAASDVADKSIDAVYIPHEGQEAYKNMWQKVRAMWTYVYVNYFDDYDWFHCGGDDMYVIVENLRLYLESEEIVNASNGGEKPLLLGQQFYQHGNRSDAYVTGGGGYTLNKAALKTLVTSFPNCAPHEVTSGEDYMVTQCLRKQGIEAYWTTDETGADRYNHVHPEFEFNFDPKKNPLFWYTYFSANENVGPARVAKRSVSFHLKSGDVVGKPKVENQMRRVHAILYGHCANVTLGPPVPTQRWRDGKILWRYWKSPIKECELKAKPDEICICSERRVRDKMVQICDVKKREIVTKNTAHQVLTNENIERKLDDNEGGSDYVRLSKSITTLKQSHAALSQKLEQAEATLNTILDNQEQMKSRIETILHHVVPNAPSPLPTKKRKASISSATVVKARTRPVVDEHEEFIAK